MENLEAIEEAVRRLEVELMKQDIKADLDFWMPKKNFERMVFYFLNKESFIVVDKGRAFPRWLKWNLQTGVVTFKVKDWY